MILHWFTDHMTPFTGLRIINMMSCTGYRSPPWYSALAYRSPKWQHQTKKDSVYLARYRWCLLSVYHDIVTCSQLKLKSFLSTWPHFLLSCLLGRWYRVDTKWRTVISLGVLYVLSCKVREHEKTTSVSTIDFPPILTYESTSANLR